MILTLIGDTEVYVDQLVELLGELEVHFCSFFAAFLFFEHEFNVGKRDAPCDEVHAVELLDEGRLDLSCALKHRIGHRYRLLWAWHGKNLQHEALLFSVVGHVILATVLDGIKYARDVVRLDIELDSKLGQRAPVDAHMRFSSEFLEYLEETINLCQLLQAPIVEPQRHKGWQNTLYLEESTGHLFKLVEHCQDDFFLQV